jgi:hypothetical protein
MSLVIRAATPHDAPALAHLAGLDRRPSLRGQVLIAETGGRPVAAVGLTSGAIVADPFLPGADAVRALRERRYRVLRQGGDVGPVTAVLRRVAPGVRTVRPHPLGGHVQALPQAA